MSIRVRHVLALGTVYEFSASNGDTFLVGLDDRRVRPDGPVTPHLVFDATVSNTGRREAFDFFMRQSTGRLDAQQRAAMVCEVPARPPLVAFPGGLLSAGVSLNVPLVLVDCSREGCAAGIEVPEDPNRPGSGAPETKAALMALDAGWHFHEGRWWCHREAVPLSGPSEPSLPAPHLRGGLSAAGESMGAPMVRVECSRADCDQFFNLPEDPARPGSGAPDPLSAMALIDTVGWRIAGAVFWCPWERVDENGLAVDS